MADYSALTARPMPQQSAGPDYSALTARKVSTGEDVARSALSGLESGAIGLATLPGDLQSLIRSKLEGLGLPKGAPLPNIFAGGMPVNMPTNAQATKAYESVRGPLYQPQTTAGEYARTAGEFAPAAIGGAGGLVRRGAQALIPAVASETAGQAARQFAPEYEDAARIGTAIATGGIGARPGASKLPKGAAPETDELKQMSTLAYDRARQAGLVIKGDSFRKMTLGLIGDMRKEGLDPTLHKNATAVMRRLAATGDAYTPKRPSPMSAMTGVKPRQPTGGLALDELDTLRKVARGAAKSIEPDERRLGAIIIERLDDYLDNLTVKHIAAGDLTKANPSIKEARSLWQRMRKSELIDDALKRAGYRAGQFSVSGKENAIRTEFRQMALRMTRDKRFRNTFTPEEQKLIQQLGNMGSGVNILRTIGKLAPRGALTIGGGAAAGYYGDPAATGAAWGVGTVAHLAALGLTKRQGGTAYEPRSQRQRENEFLVRPLALHLLH